jgi:hypothetical protein
VRPIAHQVPRCVVRVAVNAVVVPGEREARCPPASRRHILLPAIPESIIAVAESLRVLPIGAVRRAGARFQAVEIVIAVRPVPVHAVIHRQYVSIRRIAGHAQTIHRACRQRTHPQPRIVRARLGDSVAELVRNELPRRIIARTGEQRRRMIRVRIAAIAFWPTPAVCCCTASLTTWSTCFVCGSFRRRGARRKSKLCVHACSKWALASARRPAASVFTSPGAGRGNLYSANSLCL